MSCLCSPWNCAPTVCQVCGTFPTPEVPDEGQCWSLKRTILCDAPVLPVAQCADEMYITIYQPSNVSAPFAVSARLFDENCDVITDQTGAAITLILI